MPGESKVTMTNPMTIEHFWLAGLPAVRITKTGYLDTVFVRYGWKLGKPDVRIVHGIAFEGYWEAARNALSQVPHDKD